jgi:hypothetical protein
MSHTHPPKRRISIPFGLNAGSAFCEANRIEEMLLQ